MEYEAGSDERAKKALLRRRFGDAGWETGQILDAMDAADNFYFDRVSQIGMERWNQGRIALVGDAAFCPSLLAGQGSSLAMTAAYILAGELKLASGNHLQAFARYQDLQGVITGKRKAAEGLGGVFAPASRLALFVRNNFSWFLSIPLVADLAVGRALGNSLALPEY